MIQLDRVWEAGSPGKSASWNPMWLLLWEYPFVVGCEGSAAIGCREGTKLIARVPGRVVVIGIISRDGGTGNWCEC